MHTKGFDMKEPASPIFRFSPRPNRAAEISWRPWGQQAFEEARLEDKPILLSISAVWCHWCHVMDETTYSDPAVIEAINRDFIPVRVDNDREPEVNRRYNQGGWPTTAFLLPTGEILTGATYVPPQQMLALMARVIQYYRGHRQEIETRLTQLRTQLQSTRKETQANFQLSWAIVEDIDSSVLNSYDWVYGGFGTEPKFPHTDALEYSLARLHQTRDESWRKLLQTTLDAMAKGGMFDHVEGGFFRYSTTRNWTVPHFEKMLEDNSQLLRIYIAAADLLADPSLRQVADAVASYLRHTLYQPALGAFGGSQDADEEYYALESLDLRSERKAPYIDPTIYADWNALAARAATAYYLASGEAEWWAIAQSTLEFINKHMYLEGQGVCHYWDGEPHNPTNLSDQVNVAHALLDSYEAGGPESHFVLADKLFGLAMERFRAPEGGFYDTVPDPQAPGYLSLPDRPLAENALAAELAFRLYLLTDRNELLQIALDTLMALGSTATRQGLFASQFGRVAQRLMTTPVTVAVVGPAPQRHKFIVASLRCYHSNREVEPLGSDLRTKRFSDRGYTHDPAAYLCIGTTCLLPIEHPHKLETEVRKATPTVSDQYHPPGTAG